jgi:hypothetical protein
MALVIIIIRHLTSRKHPPNWQLLAESVTTTGPNAIGQSDEFGLLQEGSLGSLAEAKVQNL